MTLATSSASADSAQRSLLNDRILEFLCHEGFNGGGAGQPGQHHVDRDSVRSCFPGYGLSQTDHTCLGRRIGHLPFSADETVNRTDVDNPAPFSRSHGGKNKLDEKQRHGEVNSQHRLKSGFIDLVCCSGPVKPRIVDKDVYGEFGAVSVKFPAQSVSTSVRSTVTGTTFRPVFSDFLADLMKRTRIFFQQDEIRSAGSEHLGTCPADSLAGSGDQCSATLKVHHVSLQHWSPDREG